MLLSWIKAKKKKEDFVENNKKMRPRTTEKIWGYVKSQANPANLLTRGMEAN